MKVKEAMSHDIVLVEDDSNIQDAKRTMERAGIDCLPVVANRCVAGIITARDIDSRILAKGLDPKKTRVSDGMTEKLFVCGEDDKIGGAMKKMRRCHVRRLAVMNRDRQLVGLVSFDKCVQA